jgi:hypothetical protein
VKQNVAQEDQRELTAKINGRSNEINSAEENK